MDAVQRSDIVAFDVRSDALVCRQHELFDDAMRELSFRARDALHQPSFIELNDGLRHIEVDGATFYTFAVQNFCEHLHALELMNQRSILLPNGMVAVQDCLHLVVSHPRRRADYAFVNLVAADLAGMIDFHHAGEHQPVNMRAQTAKIRRQFQRQHGNRPIREVH